MSVFFIGDQDRANAGLTDFPDQEASEDHVSVESSYLQSEKMVFSPLFKLFSSGPSRPGRLGHIHRLGPSDCMRKG